MAAVQGWVSIDVDVQVGTTSLNFVTNIGALGGAPNSLDATCMKDRMRRNKNGVQDVDNWEVDYWFDNSDPTSDYRVLKALETAGEEVDITVTFPDGSKFTSKGQVSTWVDGFGVDALIPAKLSVALSQDWTVTNPA